MLTKQNLFLHDPWVHISGSSKTGVSENNFKKLYEAPIWAVSFCKMWPCAFTSHTEHHKNLLFKGHLIQYEWSLGHPQALKHAQLVAQFRKKNNFKKLYEAPIWAVSFCKMWPCAFTSHTEHHKNLLFKGHLIQYEWSLGHPQALKHAQLVAQFRKKNNFKKLYEAPIWAVLAQLYFGRNCTWVSFQWGWWMN